MPSAPSSIAHVDAWRRDHGVPERLRSFWHSLEDDLNASKPRISAPRHGPPTAAMKAASDGSANLYTLEMSSSDIESMRADHASYMERTAARSLDGLFVPNSSGIVTTAGGLYIPIMLVSLRLLRRTGSTLPVEVFLADETEYDATLCTTILPGLNARCRLLSDVFGTSTGNIKTYQFKMFSILLSSFDDVLFLDADALSLIDPAELFSAEPYSSTGLIIWPDFWPSTVSEAYFTIRGKAKSAGTVSTRTSESGQLVISKSTHARTLILASYYNYFGPGYYYPLFSQGAPGEGDKETFGQAADTLGLPSYRVKQDVRALGYHEGRDFHGTAMLQADPRSDFRGESARPAFIHANFPKFDPFTFLEKGVTKFSNGTAHRVWDNGALGRSRHGWATDPEKAIIEEMITVACSFGANLSTASGTHCQTLRAHYRSVFSTTR